MTQDELSARINTLFAQGQWTRARLLLESELRKAPDSHWLLTRISSTFYEERDYEKALEYAQWAFALAPECPLVLWDLAGALRMLNRDREALDIYHGMIRRGQEQIASDPCGEGLAWSRALVTDCVRMSKLCRNAIAAQEGA